MTTSALAAEAGGTTNFLLPNATLFVELLLFLIVLFVFSRFVVPPLARAMGGRDEIFRKAVEDREKAASTLRQAQERYEQALAEARAEAASIRDKARAEAAEIRAELRAGVEREIEQIRQRGAAQLAEQYEAAMTQLRSEIGDLATRLAERVIGEPISSDGQRSTMDKVLAEREDVSAAGGGN